MDNQEPRRTCVLTFVTSLGGQKNIRVNDPRNGLNAAGLGISASMFITANPFDEEKIGELVNMIRAEIITETRTILI